MDIPDILYRLSPQDRQSYPYAEAWMRNAGTSSAAASVAATIMNVENRVLLLSHIMVIAQPGAAQNVVDIQITIRPPDGSEDHWVDGKRDDGAATRNGYLTWQGSIVVPPRWRVLGWGIYNAGANANATTVTAAGIVIPLGTLRPT